MTQASSCQLMQQLLDGLRHPSGDLLTIMAFAGVGTRKLCAGRYLLVCDTAAMPTVTAINPQLR